jgi:hypothetical protein
MPGVATMMSDVNRNSTLIGSSMAADPHPAKVAVRRPREPWSRGRTRPMAGSVPPDRRTIATLRGSRDPACAPHRATTRIAGNYRQSTAHPTSLLPPHVPSGQGARRPALPTRASAAAVATAAGHSSANAREARIPLGMRESQVTPARRLVGRVGGRFAGPLGLDGQRHRSVSRPLIEPCVRFSRTRLTDIVHRRQTHAWT